MEKHIPEADSYQGSPYPNLPPPPSYEESYPSAPPSVAGDASGGPTVVTVLIDDGKFGPYSKAMRCYHCGEQIATRTETKSGTITYLLCLALCLVGYEISLFHNNLNQI